MPGKATRGSALRTANSQDTAFGQACRVLPLAGQQAAVIRARCATRPVGSGYVRVRLTEGDWGAQHDAYSDVRDILGSLKQAGFLRGEVDSICAELESLGLVNRTDALLQRGLDFADYIKSAEELRLASTAR